jgi:hypothetical protein
MSPFETDRDEVSHSELAFRQQRSHKRRDPVQFPGQSSDTRMYQWVVGPCWWAPGA